MEQHIEDLFEKALPFSDGELTFHPDFEQCSAIANTLEEMLLECFGEEVAQLVNEYTVVHLQVERLEQLHYFYEGYLTARREQKAQKKA